MPADLKHLLQASYQPQKEAAASLSKKGFTYDPELSNMTTKVLLDPKGNPVVLHRGSVRVSDWLANNTALAVGLEQYAPRFKESKRTIEKVKQKYPGTTVTSAGHSLGGALAEKSGADKVITYNKGAGLFDIGKTIKPNQTDIRTKYDLPSALSAYQTGGKKIELAGSFNPLETHKTTQLPDQLFV